MYLKNMKWKFFAKGSECVVLHLFINEMLTFSSLAPLSLRMLLPDKNGSLICLNELKISLLNTVRIPSKLLHKHAAKFPLTQTPYASHTHLVQEDLDFTKKKFRNAVSSFDILNLMFRFCIE